MKTFMCLRFILRYLHIFASLLLFLSKDDNKSRKSKKLMTIQRFRIGTTCYNSHRNFDYFPSLSSSSLVNSFPRNHLESLLLSSRSLEAKKHVALTEKPSSVERKLINNWTGMGRLEVEVWLTVESVESWLHRKSLVRVRCSKFLVASKVRQKNIKSDRPSG